MSLPGEQHVANGKSGRVAIVGMSCLFPGAPDLATYWNNIVGGVDSIREASASEWDAGFYAGRDSSHFGGIYCGRGGFISEFADFDPLQFGIMPNGVNGGDPEQFLSLRVAHDTMRDAGYLDRPFDGDRAEILLGRTSIPGVGAVNLIQHGHTVDQVLDVLSGLHPEYSQSDLQAIEAQLRGSLRPCTTDSIPAVMPNVQAGRIANRLGFKGRNLLLDAACATSLIAVETGVMDLLSGQCDVVLAGGIHVTSTACFYQMFSSLGALSRSGQARPFDRGADGTILGEGIGMVLLKRLEDAVRDGDRVYAVILGVGSSSDGRGGSALAPSVDGEALAMSRAYEMAGISPQTVALLEAHGTATAAGDTAEMQAVQRVFGTVGGTASGERSAQQWCAVGSVKSMIGHCQAASGIAGLIKAALAVYHKVLPPTLNVSEPNPAINWTASPCFINTQVRPWIHPEYGRQKTHPRRAAVSAFGFGGVNAHTVIEEFQDVTELELSSLLKQRDSEVCLFEGDAPSALTDQIDQLTSVLQTEPSVQLADIAYTLSHRRNSSRSGSYRLAIVASTTDDLLTKLASAREHLTNCPGAGIDSGESPQTGIYYSGSAATDIGKMAFILPGLGAAYPNMLQDLSIHFPEVRAVFDFVDLLVRKNGDGLLPSRQIFPLPPGFANWPASNTVSLALMDSAVVVVLLAEWALFVLLKELGVSPDAVMGCSTGEFAALTMSGASDIVAAAETFYGLSIEVARSVPAERLRELRSLRLKTSYDRIAPIMEKLQSPVYLSAEMTDRDVIVSGTQSAIEEASAAFKAAGIDFFQLPAAIPYHTPLVSGIVTTGREEVGKLTVKPPEIEAWSCSLASQYPPDSNAIFQISTELFEKPILFRKTLEAMYADGVRTFVEVGPKGTLTPVVSEVLKEKPHLAVAANLATRSGIAQIHHLLSALFCRGIEIRPDALFKRRGLKIVDLTGSAPAASKKGMRLSLTFPSLKLTDVGQLNLSKPAPHHDYAAADDDERQLPPADTENRYADGEADVVQSYLGSLASFHQHLMSVQKQILVSYLEDPAADDDSYQPWSSTSEDRQSPVQSDQTTVDADRLPQRLPFITNAIIDQADSTITVRRRLSTDTDLYLLDHAIGGTVSSASGMTDRVYLLPLMVALEIMAETGSLLVPGMVPVKLENVWAYRRIRADQSGFPISVTARPLASANNKVLVEMRRDDGVSGLPAGDPDHNGSPLMSCEIEFSTSYPEAPASGIRELADARPARLKQADLYSRTTMFHGPRMQCVRKIDGITEKAIKGAVESKGTDSWFASTNGDEATRLVLLDPNLLDNASQLVLFFLFEKELPVTALLPFHIESVEFFGPPHPPGEMASVFARLLSVSDTGTRAHVDIVAPAGALWARITGISSRRITLSQRLIDFIHNAQEVTLSETPPASGQGLLTGDDIVLIRLDDSLLPEDEVTLDWLTDYFLSASEREYWLKEMRAEKRKRQWLLGRIAAKEAVRVLVRKHSNLALAPADVEIGSATSAPPSVAGAWLSTLGWQPRVSLSHTEGTAVALASRRLHDNPGVDIEFIRPRDAGFEKMLLSEYELGKLAAPLAAERETSLTTIWCAKEAAGKALGIGLGGNPHHLVVEHFDRSTGNVAVRVPGSQASPPSRAAERQLLVRTFVDGSLLTAITLGEEPSIR